MPVTFKKPKQQIIHVTDDLDDLNISSEARQPGRSDVDPLIQSREIEIVPIEDLKPNPRNAKKHPERQIALLARNIEQHGFSIPLVVDEHSQIESGHARWLAAQRLGMRHLPVIRRTNLSPAKRRAAAIADNKLAELSRWDLDLLGEDLKYLASEEVDLDIRELGFDTPEIDQILNQMGEDEDAADHVPSPDIDAPPVTRRGDLWICNQHLLLCGDARLEADFRTLMGQDRAQIVFSDAPYNVPNAGHVTKRNGVREFAMANGEMSRSEFTEFLRIVSTNIMNVLDKGAIAYLCMDWRHMREMLEGAGAVFGDPKNVVVWVKPNAGMGSFYRSQHELIFVYAAPGKHVNNFGLGEKGRHRTNVWQLPALSSFGSGRDDMLAMHPTVKPVSMVKDALWDCSHRRDIVLDPFGGSGTTMIAAEATGRRARLMEIDAGYCDTIVERWQTISGKTARLAGTQDSFADVRKRRAE